MTKNRRHDIVKPSKFKTSMCTFFMSAEGCPFSDKCAFAHGEDELRSEPKDSGASISTSQPEGYNTTGAAVAATSSPTSSHGSEQDDINATSERKHSNSSGSNRHSHQDPHGAATAASAKRKTKKTRMDASSGIAAAGAAAVGSLHGIPGSKADGAHARCRPPRERRTLPPPPPPPMQSQGPMPSAAYNLSVAPPPPTAYALYGDFSMAYGGIPAMSGMPYYIPTVGNHPFSNINNNHHAINVVPHMHSPMPYAPTVSPPTSFPAPLPQVTPPAQSLVPGSSTPLNQKLNSANNSSSSNSINEESKRRPRQAMRHVVSSNTMAHSHGRHASNAASAPPAEVASPQYVYGLMAAAGVPLTGPLVPPAAPTAGSPMPTSGIRRSSEGPSAPSTPPQQQQQPRLVVVPHTCGSGSFVVPGNIRNYHAQTAVAEPPLPELVNDDGGSGGSHSPAATTHHNSSSSRVETSPTASSTAAAPASQAYQPPKTTPAPPTIVHIPLNGTGNGLASHTNGGGGSKSTGDALWGPAGGSVNPLASSDDASGGEDYNALLSGLGISGSGYATIPLEELVRQRGTARDDDDGGGSSGDFDWTGALERWLRTAKEETAVEKAETPPAAVVATTSVSATASTTTTTTAIPAAAHLPQASQPVASALNHTPVLMDGAETKLKTTTMSAEGRRKPTVVCQVSRAGGKPVPPTRRAPVMTNQFKSSCVAEADSGSVLLYCAEKNTLVYITSGNGTSGSKATATAAAEASQTGSTPSNRKPDATAATTDAAHARARCQESPSMAGSTLDLDLGIDVRFNPGRKKHSVLVPEVSDDDAEYCI
ncbi:zinc finger (CCCH type) protein [Lotmaria passim]